MKKFIKLIVLILILLVFIVVAFKFASYYINENLFKLDDETAEKYLNEVNAYLSNKYKEEMVIYDYSYYEIFSAQVYPKNNSEIKFMVYGGNNLGEYKDDYMETYLEYQARNKIEKIVNTYFNYCELAFSLKCPESEITLDEYLYNKYKSIQIPIDWDNPYCNEIFDIIHIRIYNKSDISNELKEKIGEKIKAENINFIRIEWEFRP